MALRPLSVNNSPLAASGIIFRSSRRVRCRFGGIDPFTPESTGAGPRWMCNPRGGDFRKQDQNRAITPAILRRTRR